MTWSDFYLTCFVAGFVLSLLSFLGGSLHLPHVHHPHLHGGPVNFGTITAFLVWFGGVGFVLTRFYSVGLIVATTTAVVAGLIAAGIVFIFLARVLGRNDRDLDPADFEMRGVLGRVSSTVRESGTGEMIFTQQGTRRGVPIRSEGGHAIPRGTEVLVTRYESGIAYVREFNQTPESD